MDAARALNVLTCALDGTQLIEASAGTGKTWNICGLYLRLLLERGLAVQQILVVTFTNAATAELRERIRSRIAETLARLRGTGAAPGDPFVDHLLHALRTRHGLADDAMALRLDLALQTFDEAAIFTIHGFCQRALADTPFTSGMPMALELLADDTELRMEVVHDFWRNAVAGGATSPALAAHLLAHGDRPETWGRLLARQLGKPLSTLIWPDGIDTATPVDTAALAAAHAAARRTWAAERERIVAAVTEALPRLNGNRYKPDSVAAAAASWDRLLAGRDPLAAPRGLDKLDLFAQSRLRPNKGREPPQPHAFFAQAEALLEQRAATAQGLATERARLLRRLLTQAPATLRRLKRERRVVAFDDMLYNLYERLASGSQPWLAGALRSRFPAALIDEFQDTDPLQFAIFQAIYGAAGAPPAPLFLVGDPKQAIYSFRHADLHTYLQAKREAHAEHTLADNQRSSRELLAGLNGLFSANPQAFMLPGLDYRPVNFGAKPRQPWVDHTLARAPLQLWALPADAAGEPLPKARARHAAAAACAGEIARLLGAAQRGAITRGGTPLSGGDMAVLVRSHAQGSAMRAALAALGVGSVELSQASVFESPDAEELARVLAAILEPARDRLLRAALATDLLGFDAGQVDAISADEPRLLGFVMRFSDYREAWTRRGLGAMLRGLFVAEGVNARLLARPDGERRLTNLLHLAELLHQAAPSQGTPERQLRWLQTQRSDGSTDDAAQLRLESDRNLVQIVTIHKSKGLEYPVVFCPFLWDGHPGGPRAGLEGREYHDAAGRPVLDFRAGPGDAAITAQIALERAAENLRLIYVALTRAVQRCYLVVGSYAGSAFGRATTAQSARSLLNWLVAGAGRAPSDWQKNTLTPAEIGAAWQAFSAAHAGAVDLAPLPAGPWTAVPPPRLAPDALAALAPPGRIAGAWWIGSYTSLSLGVRHEGAAVDHDARIAGAEDADAGDEAPVPADDDVLNFPRGAEAGVCMHAVFERADFTDPGGWPAAIAAALRARPRGEPGAALLPRMLNRMLADVTRTPLPTSPGADQRMTLAQLPNRRRLVELEFTLPAGQVSSQALAALLREHGYPVPALSFGTLEGYLRGFIDLVFEHEGRFHLLDWKSNHLGHRPADYGPAPVAQAMQRHGYHLQYLLYAAALHRLLGRRLRDYRYEQHFGAVLYLFVRGVRPAWRAADGTPAGVFVDRPPQRLIERLAALFDPAGAAA